MSSDDDRKQREREEQQASAIKVTDRRAFTREGARRDPDSPPEPEPEPAPVPADEPRAAAATGSASARPSPAMAAADPDPALDGMASADAAELAEDSPGSIDFVAFVQSLYVSALMALGEVENPYTHQLEANLDLARQNIDLLVMLREKTTGNLTREEDGFIQQVVPQLQLLFAKKAR